MQQQFTVYRLVNGKLNDSKFMDLFKVRSCAFNRNCDEAIKANLELINLGYLVPAATVTCTVGDLFELTNTINDVWHESSDITLLRPLGECRLSSSTMGDVFKDASGKLFMYTMSSIVPLEQ